MPAGISAFTPLANVTLGASASTVTFSGISQAYRDLVLVANVITSSSTYTNLRINSDTGTNYPQVVLGYDGSSKYSFLSNSGSAYIQGNFPTNSTDYTIERFDFLDYSATDKHKMFLIRQGRGSAGTEAVVSRWANTGAITNITFTVQSGTYSAGCSFALYGVSA